MRPAPPPSRAHAAMATTTSKFRSRAGRCGPLWPTPSAPEEDRRMPETTPAQEIGLPLDRVDARLKVTGAATYAYEYAAQGHAAYGVIVPASIAKGRVIAVDVREAQRAPGVQLILTKDNAPAQHPFGPVDLPD